MSLPKLKSFNIQNFGGADRGPGFLDDHPSVLVGPQDEEYDEETGESPTYEYELDASGEKRTQPIDSPYGLILPPGCSSITSLIIKSSAVSPTLLGRIIAHGTGFYWNTLQVVGTGKCVWEGNNRKLGF